MKKKVEELEPDNLIYVRINRTDHEKITEYGNPENRWDGDDVYHNHSIDGYEVVGKQDGYDFVLNEKPEGNWYLVCAYYSSGDSFHKEENCLSLISFVKSVEDAKCILKALEEDYRTYLKKDSNRTPISVHLPVSDKIEEVYTGTWKGYFERLTSFEIETLNNNGDMKVVFN